MRDTHLDVVWLRIQRSLAVCQRAPVVAQRQLGLRTVGKQDAQQGGVVGLQLDGLRVVRDGVFAAPEFQRFVARFFKRLRALRHRGLFHDGLQRLVRVTFLAEHVGYPRTGVRQTKNTEVCGEKKRPAPGCVRHKERNHVQLVVELLVLFVAFAHDLFHHLALGEGRRRILGHAGDCGVVLTAAPVADE